MRRSDFYYELPDSLVAQYPLAARSDSRLLCLNGDGLCEHRMITDLPDQLNPGDLLVFNDTRVVPARLWGRKETGGRVEILLERAMDHGRALVQLRASKPLRPGTRLEVSGGLKAEVVARRGQFFELRFLDPRSVVQIFEAVGSMPLPPYISRQDEEIDRERYQTVFARRDGAVAAPTAGLHFDRKLLRRLDDRGVRRTCVTLHVGAGTFQPLRVDELQQHRMHSEWVEVGARTCASINATRARGGRVVAVGTTVVRALEAASEPSEKGTLFPYTGETDLFITPGFRFNVVDALVTNFHLPESSLLVLVCAFGGTENVLHAYRQAVAHRYRFYSYGDAMFVTSNK